MEISTLERSKLINLLAFSLLQNVNTVYSHTLTSGAHQSDYTLNFLFLNIRSLRKRLISLSNFLKFSQIKYHAVILNETNLEKHETHLFNIPHYNSFHSVREKIRGGVSIFLDKTIKGETRENYEFENINFLVLKLPILNIHIIGIYRPPDSNPLNFNVHLQDILSKFSRTFVFGDFNHDLFKPHLPNHRLCEQRRILSFSLFLPNKGRKSEKLK